MEHHTTSRSTYLLVYLVLIVLLAATIGVTFVDLGPFNLLISMAIAITKALLVVLFFMHVRESDRLTRVFVIAGFVWLAILIGLTLSDYLTRPGAG